MSASSKGQGSGRPGRLKTEDWVQGTVQGAEGAGCRVQGGGWPGPVGKELQCVTQRLAGGDPLCNAIVHAVRDGMVWVGGCDEREERKRRETEGKVQQPHATPRHTRWARAHEYRRL